MDLSGAILEDGRYRVGRLLGRGSMGEVYEGQRIGLAGAVAIKVLASQHATDPGFVQRFDREMQAASRLDHPNIARVFDYGTVLGDRQFLVMEVVVGESLSDLVEREAPLSVERAVDITGQVLDALAAAHAAGIVHRDVKPSNVMLRRGAGPHDQFVKLLDFGIASLRGPGIQSFTRTGQVCGTPAYMSPEVAQGRRATPASDLYAVGIMLYELLAGRRPFAGETPLALMYAHVNDAPAALIRADLPPRLRELISRALDKQPHRRPPSAAAFRSMLREAVGPTESVANLETLDRPPAPVPPPRRSGGGRLLAFSLIAVVLGGSGTWFVLERSGLGLPDGSVPEVAASAVDTVERPARPEASRQRASESVATEPLPPRGALPVASAPPSPRARGAELTPRAAPSAPLEEEVSARTDQARPAPEPAAPSGATPPARAAAVGLGSAAAEGVGAKLTVVDPLRWEVLPWFAERSAVVTALASLTGDAPRLASPSRVIGRQLTALDQRGWDLASGKLASQRYLAQFGHTPAPSVAWVKVFGSPDEKTAVRVFIEAVDGVVIAVYLRLFSRVPNLESWLQQALGRAPDAVDGADLRSHPRHVTFSFPGGSGRPRPARTRVALWRADAQTLVHTREFQNLRTSVAWRAVVAADARALASWAEARGYRMPLPVTSWGDR